MIKELEGYERVRIGKGKKWHFIRKLTCDCSLCSAPDSWNAPYSRNIEGMEPCSLCQKKAKKMGGTDE